MTHSSTHLYNEKKYTTYPQQTQLDPIIHSQTRPQHRDDSMPSFKCENRIFVRPPHFPGCRPTAMMDDRQILRFYLHIWRKRSERTVPLRSACGVSSADSEHIFLPTLSLFVMRTELSIWPTHGGKFHFFFLDFYKWRCSFDPRSVYMFFFNRIPSCLTCRCFLLCFGWASNVL